MDSEHPDHKPFAALDRHMTFANPDVGKTVHPTRRCYGKDDLVDAPGGKTGVTSCDRHGAGAAALPDTQDDTCQNPSQSPCMIRPNHKHVGAQLTTRC